MDINDFFTAKSQRLEEITPDNIPVIDNSRLERILAKGEDNFEKANKEQKKFITDVMNLLQNVNQVNIL